MAKAAVKIRSKDELLKTISIRAKSERSNPKKGNIVISQEEDENEDDAPLVHFFYQDMQEQITLLPEGFDILSLVGLDYLSLMGA